MVHDALGFAPLAGGHGWIKEIALRRSGTYTEVNAILYWATPKLLAVRRVTVLSTIFDLSPTRT